MINQSLDLNGVESLTIIIVFSTLTWSLNGDVGSCTLRKAPNICKTVYHLIENVSRWDWNILLEESLYDHGTHFVHNRACSTSSNSKQVPYTSIIHVRGETPKGNGNSPFIGVLITVDFLQSTGRILLQRYLKVSGQTRKFSFHSSGVNRGTILSHQSLLLSLDQISRSLRIACLHNRAPITKNMNIFLCLSRNRWILNTLKHRFLLLIFKRKNDTARSHHSIFLYVHVPKLCPCSYCKYSSLKPIYEVCVNATSTGLCEIGF